MPTKKTNSKTKSKKTIAKNEKTAASKVTAIKTSIAKTAPVKAGSIKKASAKNVALKKDDLKSVSSNIGASQKNTTAKNDLSKSAEKSKKTSGAKPIAGSHAKTPAAGASVKLRKARIGDSASIHELVLFYAKREEMLPRSLNEIYENIRDFTVVEKEGRVIACCGLHVCWSDLAEIKSLAVKLEECGAGLGAMLVRHAVKEAKEIGIVRLFTLTFKEEFFHKQGFRRVDVNDLPKKVWSECVRCVHFPDCDEIAMVRDLVTVLGDI